MALNEQQLIELIEEHIKPNLNEEITGAINQNVLLQMVSTMFATSGVVNKLIVTPNDITLGQLNLTVEPYKNANLFQFGDPQDQEEGEISASLHTVDGQNKYEQYFFVVNAYPNATVRIDHDGNTDVPGELDLYLSTGEWVFCLGAVQKDGGVLTQVIASNILFEQGFPAEKYTNPEPSVIAVGGIPIGTTFDEKTMQEMWDMALYPELFPTLTDPNNTFNLPNAGLHEAGAEIDLSFSNLFTRGSIDPAYGTSGLRSGPPNAHIITGPDIAGTFPSTEMSYLTSIIGWVVDLGSQSWGGRVAYDAGEQPLSSKGNPYDEPLPAGETSEKTVTITGVLPYFATTGAIDVLAKQPLALMDSSWVQTNMVAEQGGDKQRASFPFEWEVITGIQFFNTVSNQWEWIGGSPSASLATFTVTVEERIINGEPFDYNLFTHNGAQIGARNLRWFTT